jgi:hypothetical protein
LTAGLKRFFWWKIQDGGTGVMPVESTVQPARNTPLARTFIARIAMYLDSRTLITRSRLATSFPAEQNTPLSLRASFGVSSCGVDSRKPGRAKLAFTTVDRWCIHRS